MEIRNVLAFNLRTLRRKAGLSQEDLADRAGLDRTYISSLERQVYAASIDTLDKIAGALGVEAFELLVSPQRDGRPG